MVYSKRNFLELMYDNYTIWDTDFVSKTTENLREISTYNPKEILTVNGLDMH